VQGRLEEFTGKEYEFGDGELANMLEEEPCVPLATELQVLTHVLLCASDIM
jgi:hypothetical protein